MRTLCRVGYFKDEDEIQIVTPFDVCPEPDKPYSYYMGKDIEALLECDAIYLCEGVAELQGLHGRVRGGKNLW